MTFLTPCSIILSMIVCCGISLKFFKLLSSKVASIPNRNLKEPINYKNRCPTCYIPNNLQQRCAQTDSPAEVKDWCHSWVHSLTRRWSCWPDSLQCFCYKRLSCQELMGSNGCSNIATAHQGLRWRFWGYVFKCAMPFDKCVMHRAKTSGRRGWK